ncbi:MAG: hypothetical protein KGL16_14245 [Acidobacteriota bacterium]|nr:hypothetical protein [Acidobacteriota bacterium]
MTRTSRALLAAVFTALASVAILATLLAGYASRVLVSSSSFTDRAVGVVRNGAVESLIAGTVTDRVVAIAGGGSSVRPTIEQSVHSALSNPQITREIRASAGSLQAQLMSGTANSLTLTLADAGPAIAASVGSRSPQLAAALGGIGPITVLSVAIPASDSRLVHDVSRAAHDWQALLGIAAALGLLALIVTPDRARTLRRLGVGALMGGLLTAAVYLAGRRLVVDAFTAQDARTVAAAAWSAYLGGLVTWGLVLAAGGALVAVAATLGVSLRRARVSYDRVDRPWP